MTRPGWSRSPGRGFRPGSESWCRRHERRAGRACRHDPVPGRRPGTGAGTGGGDQDLPEPAAGDRAGAGLLHRRQRRAGRCPGPLGVGEDHAAAPGRHLGQADLRHGAGHRPGRGRAVGPAAGRAAGQPDRIRLPAVLPGRAADRAGQRGRRAAVRRILGRRAPRTGSGSAGAGRARPQTGRAAGPAVRGRAAAGRDRPGAGRLPADRACRRAHREPGPGHRRRHPGPARRTQPGRRHDRGGHPRPGHRRADAPADPDARRADRRRQRRGGPAAGSPPAGRAGGNPMTTATPAAGAGRGGRGARPMALAAPSPARLRTADLARLAAAGLAARKLRAALSALGIAIGVAAIVAVLGLSQSSAAGLNAEIAALGTNLLTVQNGQTFAGGTADLPTAASTSLAQGRFLNAATAREPVAVLGAAAAQRMGIDRIWPGERIWVGGKWFYVTGILKPAVLAPEIDSSVLIGYPAAGKYLNFDGHPSTIYVKAATSRVRAVDSLLAAQANPENPSYVTVSQPSAALTAQAAAKGAFSTLFLGLGAVALLVGAIGVANIMVISVLERRSEIGLRRALGATKGHIRIQFLSEAIVLSLFGGAAGVGSGAAATAIYACHKGWATVIPPKAWVGGIAAAVLIGALAGLLPAIRAARLSPTQALWTI